jgi:hypothetical protein
MQDQKNPTNFVKIRVTPRAQKCYGLMWHFWAQVFAAKISNNKIGNLSSRPPRGSIPIIFSG